MAAGHSVSAGFSHVNGDLILVFTLFWGGGASVVTIAGRRLACSSPVIELLPNPRIRDGEWILSNWVLFTCYSNRLLHVCRGFPWRCFSVWLFNVCGGAVCLSTLLFCFSGLEGIYMKYIQKGEDSTTSRHFVKAIGAWMLIWNNLTIAAISQL